MTVAYVGALAALAGVLLGNLLNRSADYRRWFRSESHAACARLLAGVEETAGQYAAQTSMDAVLARDPLIPPEMSTSARLLVKQEFGWDPVEFLQDERSRRDRLSTAVQEVRLLCPDAVAVAAVALTNAALDLRGSVDEEVWQRRFQHYKERRTEFVDRARRFIHPQPRLRRITRFLYRGSI